jgi:antagonist of KipI
MSIIVIKQGMADSIQDLGRYGFQHQGINPNGAMDPVAAQAANILVGNNLNEAVVELHFPSSVLLFKEEALAALAGADFGAKVNDVPVPVNTPFIIEKDCVLQCTQLLEGARCYLAIRHGFALPEWLKSKSTNIMAGAGGNGGNYLKKGDTLYFNEKNNYAIALKHKNERTLPWKMYLKELYTTNDQIRITPGHEYHELTEIAKNLFHSSAFVITPQSNRMAYRMKGYTLHLQKDISMLSSAVTKGTIQLLPDGQLIILMADHQTTGGYPRVGHVISADIPKLAQLQPNEAIRFEMIEQEEAVDALLHQQKFLNEIKEGSNLQLNNWLANFNLK